MRAPKFTFGVLAALLGVLSSTEAQGWSSQQLAAVLGDGPLSGDSTSLAHFDVYMALNTTHVLVTLNATSTRLSRLGWMSFSPGTKMMNADMLVAWPNGDGKDWTLSHRHARGIYMPELASTADSSSTEVFFTWVPELSTTDSSLSFSTVSYLRQAEAPSNYPGGREAHQNYLNGSQPFIYASSTKNPGRSDESYQMQQHDQAIGAIALDLSLPLATSSLPEPAGEESEHHHHVHTQRSSPWITAHAVLFSLAFVVLSPFAVLIGRFGRGLPYWSKVHQYAQWASSACVVVGLAASVVYTQGFQAHGRHKEYGWIISAIFGLQAVGGWWAHRYPLPSATSARGGIGRFPTLRTDKHWSRRAHVLLGTAMLLVGYYQCGISGFEIWATHTPEPVSWVLKLVFWGLALATIGALGAGWTWDKRMRQREADGGVSLPLVAAGAAMVASAGAGATTVWEAGRDVDTDGDQEGGKVPLLGAGAGETTAEESEYDERRTGEVLDQDRRDRDKGRRSDDSADRDPFED